MSTSDNIRHVRQVIADAALRTGRSPGSVRLMAVTKTVSDERLEEAIRSGVEILGENYVQEAKRKVEQMGRVCEWHLIGRLQTNKAKYAVQLFDMIHSVDRMELAVELDRRARAVGRIVKVLIEVNVGAEQTKGGTTIAEAPALVRAVAPLTGLAIAGLMTINPWVEDAEEARPFFRALRALRDQIEAEAIPRVSTGELSMGTSEDYAVAVEEGATIVRVGRAIFGERP